MVTKKAFLLSFFIFFGIDAHTEKETTDITSLSLSTHTEDIKDALKVDASQKISYEQKLEKNKKFFYKMLFYSAFCKAIRPTFAFFALATYSAYPERRTVFYHLCNNLVKISYFAKKIMPLIGIIPFIQDKMWDKRIIFDKRILFSYVKGYFTGFLSGSLLTVLTPTKRATDFDVIDATKIRTRR